MEHPLLGDDRGTVVVVDLTSKKRMVSSEWSGEEGLSWSADGREVWFTATNTFDWERALYAVSQTGKSCCVLRPPASLYLEDILPDRRVLLRSWQRRYEVAAGQIGGTTHLVNWHQIMVATSLSRSGRYAVIGDMSGPERDYGVYLIKLDGSLPVLLGSQRVDSWQQRAGGKRRLSRDQGGGVVFRSHLDD
jgi:hypothetical protein